MKSTLLVPSISATSGIIVFLLLSGMLLSGFKPLKGIVEASSYGSFSYVTKKFGYEFTEASYNMDDMSNGTHLYDFSDKRHFGRVEGSLEFQAGYFGRALEWLNGYIIGEDLNITDMSFTIEAWIYPISPERLALTAAFETVYPIIWKWENGSMAYQYAGGTAVVYSNKAVGLNSWTHVALVYDLNSRIARWYLNGSEQGWKGDVLPKDWDGKWIIGRFKPELSTYQWKGRIDEFRIYEGVLIQSRIQEDMKTSIGKKLTVYGLTPHSDVAELWYPNGEMLDKLRETADANGIVEFNVYSFSGGSSSFRGVLKVIRSGRTYASPPLELSWGDVYLFSVQPLLTEMQMAVLVAAFVAVTPPILMLIRRHFYWRRKGS